MATAASPESLRNDDSSFVDSAYDVLELLLSPLASLKLTVTLFALSIFIIFVGTLAQAEMSMWEVKNQFFESYITRIPFNVMMPKSFFPGRPDFGDWAFYFPGGATIGLLLLLNLISAHVIRFKIRAQGAHLAIGVLGMTIGAAITFVVILGGHNRDGIQGLPWFDWGTLWLMLKLSLVAFWFLAVYATIQLWTSRESGDQDRKIVELSLMATAVLMLTALIGYLLFEGSEAALSASSMRILWQLIQGTLCGVALLFGAIYLFQQRGGIVVMHLGVGLLMISELLVSLTAVEQQMTIYEGETVNFARDIRTTELAIVQRGNETDTMTVVPRNLLKASYEKQSKISNDQLPFDMIVRDYMKNSNIEEGEPGEGNPATAGAGLHVLALPARGTGGAEASDSVDLPSLYVELFEKGTDKSLGVYMLSTLLTAQDYEDQVTVGEQDYYISFRFKRQYKPYSVTLIETEREDYEGTSQAKSYQSLVRIVDPSRNNEFEELIWMNNPLRYAGETFYQSGHNFDRGREFSVLQIVSNLGWMIPYVSCMIVAVGMFYHFGLTWRRFMNRREASTSPLDFLNAGGVLAWLSALMIVVVLAGYALGRKEKLPESSGMDLEAFASLPVLYEGRVQPLDTLARNTLKIVSDRESVTLPADEPGADIPAYRKRRDDEVKLPAIVWFLDVVAEKPEASDYPIFRIDHPEIQNLLGLERRKGHRYSVNEILDEFDKVEQMAREARQVEDKSTLTVLQRRTIELTRRTRAFMAMVVAFRAQSIPDYDYSTLARKVQQGEQLDEQSQAMLMMLRQIQQAAQSQDAQLAATEPPLLIPTKPGGDWLPFATAKHAEMFTPEQEDEKRPAILFDNILAAYRSDSGGKFNKNVGAYQRSILQQGGDRIEPAKLDREASFNRQAMFTDAMVLYFIAFLSMLVAYGSVAIYRNRPGVDVSRAASWINRLSFLLIVGAFLIHSMALIIRMNLSGRPPVTNLYSSAIFIGWGCVLLGLAIELFYRYGVGNVVSAIAGFSTLIIANILSGDGDTMKVLVAVLDTQFWLATHVVCITLGYSTTYMAGLLGAIFIIGGIFTPALGARARRDLTRMTYAILCFSIFFSFVGTVLGGLWADDSWGRFWGWDPKENGALMIVIWNALVLHARWGAMIKERGLAMLSVLGMIVTSWSWFGVNELGVGLHSYGFTDGVLFTLGVTSAVMLIISLTGLLPKKYWLSHYWERVSTATPSK